MHLLPSHSPLGTAETSKEPEKQHDSCPLVVVDWGSGWAEAMGNVLWDQDRRGQVTDDMVWPKAKGRSGSWWALRCYLGHQDQCLREEHAGSLGASRVILPLTCQGIFGAHMCFSAWPWWPAHLFISQFVGKKSYLLFPCMLSICPGSTVDQYHLSHDTYIGWSQLQPYHPQVSAFSETYLPSDPIWTSPVSLSGTVFLLLIEYFLPLTSVFPYNSFFDLRNTNSVYQIFTKIGVIIFLYIVWRF